MELLDPGRGIAIVSFLVLLLALASVRSPIAGGRGLLLLRSLFPTWRFFEEVTDVPVLFYRLSNDAVTFGEWVPCPTAPRCNWFTPLLNPRGNFVMACNSLLQLFEEELLAANGKQTEAIRQSVSFSVIANLVRSEIADNPLATTFEYRLARVTQGASLDSAETFFISPVLRVFDV